MKILMITQNFYPEIGSASNRMKNFYSILKEQGHEVTVLTTEPNYPNRKLYSDESFWDEDIPEEDIVRVQLKTRKYTNKIFNRLIYYFEMVIKLTFYSYKVKSEYDTVLATSPAIFVGIAGAVAQRKLKARFILDVRDLWPESLIGVERFHNKFVLRLAYRLERSLYLRADHIIVNSESFAPYIVSKGIPEDKITFLPNSLTEAELNQSAQKYPEVRDELTVLYAGNVGLAQDVGTFIEIAKHLQAHTHIKFELIGYGFMMDDIVQKATDQQLSNMSISPAKSRKMTLKKISEADIVYVTLKDSEVFETVLPGKIVDCMGVGKPIVGNISGYSSDVIKTANCGLVSGNGSLAELSELILKLAASKELRCTLGQNGYRYAKEKFNWSINSKILLDLINKTFDTYRSGEESENECMHVCLESLHE